MSRTMHLFRITFPTYRLTPADKWERFFDVKAINMRTAINANFDRPNEIAIIQFHNTDKHWLFRVKVESGLVDKASVILIGWIEHIGVVE